MQRIFYRIGQFWRALGAKPDPDHLDIAEQHLSPELFSLFLRMQPFEQAHALDVFNTLVVAGNENPDLLTAGLLHDVGKVQCSLHPWERALAVLGQKLLPDQAGKWGKSEAKGLRRGFVVAVQHAEWGAELVRDAGASELVIRIIAHHQEQAPHIFTDEEAALLSALQEVDAVN